MMRGTINADGALSEAPLIRVAEARGTLYRDWRSTMDFPMNDLTDTEHTTLDVAFGVLSHPYRRRILIRVHDSNPRDEPEFSAAALAEDADEDELVDIELHHRHLPKLAEAGYIDWDREANEVRRGPRFDEIAPLIELMRNHPDELPSGWP